MGKTFNDAALADLGATVTSIEKELASPSVGPEALRALSKQLVAQLALDPPSRTRACPKCNVIGMAAATRCGSCWTTLVPDVAAKA